MSTQPIQSTSNTPKQTTDEILAEIARLRAENQALKTAKVLSLKLKISEKGAVSLYGIGRWPATFYQEQWEAILGAGDQIKAFIAANKGKLSSKGDEKPEKPEAAPKAGQF